MKINSLLEFAVIRRLVFRIKLAMPGSDAHLSEEEIARSLSKKYPFRKMKVAGDIGTFSGFDGWGEPASFAYCRARAYRHNLGACVDRGGQVIVQFGLRSAGESDLPHLRAIINECVKNERYLLVEMMQELATACGEPSSFDESRIILKEIEAAFFLDQLTIEEVELGHQSTSAGALETMSDAKGRVCWYQIGKHLDIHKQAEVPCTAVTREVEGIGLWEQTREFALHSADLLRQGRLGVVLLVRLRGTISLRAFDEKNLLAGLELYRSTRRAGKRSRVGVDDWDIWESWARIVLETSAVGARD